MNEYNYSLRCLAKFLQSKFRRVKEKEIKEVKGKKKKKKRKGTNKGKSWTVDTNYALLDIISRAWNYRECNLLSWYLNRYLPLLFHRHLLLPGVENTAHENGSNGNGLSRCSYQCCIYLLFLFFFFFPRAYVKSAFGAYR